MIVNFSADQMANLRNLCNEFNRTTGLQLKAKEGDTSEYFGCV